MYGTHMASKRKFKAKPQIEVEPIDPLTDCRGITPERERQSQGHSEWGEDERGNKTLRTMRDSPIDRALAKRIINEKQYAVAIKYRHHWYRAGLAPSVASLDLEGVHGADPAGFSGMARSDIQYYHRQRFREAVNHIGPIGALVVNQVVCAELPIEDAGYKLGWGSRPQAYAAAVERMKGALDDLVKLWGV